MSHWVGRKPFKERKINTPYAGQYDLTRGIYQLEGAMHCTIPHKYAFLFYAWPTSLRLACTGLSLHQWKPALVLTYFTDLVMARARHREGLLAKK